MWESVCLLLYIEIMRLITSISFLVFMPGVQWHMELCIKYALSWGHAWLKKRKTCKCCMKCQNAVYAKLRNRKFLRSQVKSFVVLLRGCKTDKFLVALEEGLQSGS